MPSIFASRLSFLHLALALGLALCSAAPAAAVYVDIHMYVAGDGLGGQIVVDGASEPPPGTCGAHFSNPEAWYWAEGGPDGAAETGPLDDLPHNGEPTASLQLTGQFPGCPAAPYLAITPATPDGEVPAEAISLVVQIDLADIEWLDFNGDPMPEPEWQGSVVFDPCTLPGFCEELTLGGPCVAHPWLDICQGTIESDGLLVQVADFAASIPAQVAIARKQLAAGRPKDADASLSLARSRAGQVIGQLGGLRTRQAATVKEVAKSHPSTGAAISLGNVSAGFELGILHTTACGQNLDKARQALAAGRTPDWAAVDAACLPAAEPLLRSRVWLGRLRAWGLRGSAQR